MDPQIRPWRSEEVPFNSVPVKCYDSDGHSIYRRLEFGMPKLGPYSWLLDFVLFLYETPEAAKTGVNSGGTGFYVALPSKRWPQHVGHVHAVSNWHVTTGGPPPPCSVIRVPRLDGSVEAIDLLPDDWIYRAGKSDIAVSPPLHLNPKVHQVQAAHLSVLLDSEAERKAELGPADDVFMLGRFVDYEGIEQTVPAFRFGHISIFDAKIRQLTGYEGRSIVVDMHSRSGFSGSPVFYYRTPGSFFWEGGTGENAKLITAGHELKLIGIHYGQFPEEWELKDKQCSQDIKHQQALITEGKYVEGLSGMTCVAPAQDIIDTINLPELVAMREAKEIEMEKQLGSRPLGPKAEKRRPIVSGEAGAAEGRVDNPHHKEDFMSLLNAAAKTKPQDD